MSQSGENFISFTYFVNQLTRILVFRFSHIGSKEIKMPDSFSGRIKKNVLDSIFD